MALGNNYIKYWFFFPNKIPGVKLYLWFPGAVWTKLWKESNQIKYKWFTLQHHQVLDQNCHPKKVLDQNCALTFEIENTIHSFVSCCYRVHGHNVWKASIENWSALQ